jgi:hypothetical protein
MQFEDPELQQFMQKVNAVPVGNLSPECRPIFILMDAFGWFRIIDGEPLPFQHPWQPQSFEMFSASWLEKNCDAGNLC